MLLFLTVTGSDGGGSLLIGLYKKYRELLFRCASQYVTRYQDAEDVVHDVFCIAVQYSKMLAELGEESCLHFLFVCTRNRALNFTKKQSRVVLVSEPWDANEIPEDIKLGELLEDRTALKKAMAAAKKLRPSYADVLYLHLEGFTVARIAELFKEEPEAVRKRLYRAKKKLRELMLEEGEE